MSKQLAYSSQYLPTYRELGLSCPRLLGCHNVPHQSAGQQTLVVLESFLPINQTHKHVRFYQQELLSEMSNTCLTFKYDISSWEGDANILPSSSIHLPISISNLFIKTLLLYLIIFLYEKEIGYIVQIISHAWN